MADLVTSGNGEGDRSLLIVDDNARFSETLASEFRDRGYAVSRAADMASLQSLVELDVDFAIVDLRLGADSGLDAIQIILKHSPKAKVVVPGAEA